MTEISEIDDRLKFLREELLNEIRDSESRANMSKRVMENEITEKFEAILQNNNESKLRLDSIQDFQAKFQVKVMGNYDDFESFKTNTSEDLFKNTLYVKDLQKDLANIINKFDKMFIENLIIPGKIGDYCQYKNMRDYISVKIIIINFSLILITWLN